MCNVRVPWARLWAVRVKPKQGKGGKNFHSTVVDLTTFARGRENLYEMDKTCRILSVRRETALKFAYA